MAHRAQSFGITAPTGSQQANPREVAGGRRTCRSRTSRWTQEAVARSSAEVSRVASEPESGTKGKVVWSLSEARAWDCTDRAAAELQCNGDQGVNANAARIAGKEGNCCPYFHTPDYKSKSGKVIEPV